MATVRKMVLGVVNFATSENLVTDRHTVRALWMDALHIRSVEFGIARSRLREDCHQYGCLDTANHAVLTLNLYHNFNIV